MIAVVGPTATGKSDLGVALAQMLGGEVINADAFQLYRGMDIGTAKLTVPERRGVIHHQLDVLDIRQDASVAVYQREVLALCPRVAVPLLVGGSGLYIRAVVDQLVFPGTDADLRSAIDARTVDLSDEDLHRRLAELDPAAASAILPGNRRRIIRALEVIELTGRPFSATLPDFSRNDALQLGLEVRHPDVLDQVVDRRVTRMIDDGLVEEVENLERLGLSATRTASRAIGYLQILAHLRGELTLSEAADATALATRQLIRKQRKWFRRDPRITWLDALDPHLIDKALELAAARPPRIN